MQIDDSYNDDINKEKITSHGENEPHHPYRGARGKVTVAPEAHISAMPLCTETLSNSHGR